MVGDPSGHTHPWVQLGIHSFGDSTHADRNACSIYILSNSLWMHLMTRAPNESFEIERNEIATENVLWFKLNSEGKREACSSREAFSDYRQRAKKDDRHDHPAVISMFQLMPKLAYTVAKKGKNPQLGEAVLYELEKRLLRKVELHRDDMVSHPEKLPANQQHWAHYLADYDLDGGRSPESYLYHAACNAWLEVASQTLEDEAHILLGTKECETLEKARAKVKKNLIENAKALREGQAEKNKSNGPPTVPLGDWIEVELDTSPTNEFKRSAELEFVVKGILVPEDASAGQLQMKLHDFATPFRSPIRVATMAQAFNDMCDAMVGMTPQGGRKPLGRNHSEAFKAYWGVLEGRYEEFALNEPMEALVKKLPAYANADQLKDVIKVAKNLWLNPPEDEPADSRNVLDQKRRFRALCARCWELCLPSRLTKDLSEEAIKKQLAMFKQAVAEGKIASKPLELKQPFQALRATIHYHLRENMLRTTS